ncbi:MAG: adenine phosphoribosyltransferase [Firmicutes bacterium]|nr:adenine phosphoribosyltransferase [Bacillota bacterium]
MKNTYPLTVAGIHRDLPLCSLNEDMKIAGFVIFGDVELTCACAGELLKLVDESEYDYMVAPEAKSIPLIHEMARQSGRNEYIILRKGKKAYMQHAFEAEDRSITTAGTQKLYMDGVDADKIRGKRVLLVDDVISTGGSIAAAEDLVTQAGATVAARLSILAEGKAKDRTDIRFLEALPLFDREGNPL